MITNANKEIIPLLLVFNNNLQALAVTLAQLYPEKAVSLLDASIQKKIPFLTFEGRVISPVRIRRYKEDGSGEIIENQNKGEKNESS